MTQDEALDILKTGRSVFLTGPAGSGKTHVLNEYLAYLRRFRVEVGITASTGIAATHVGGMTIHAWSGIGIKDTLTDDDIRRLLANKTLASRFEKTKVLVIDEISMLDALRLDLVDRVLRHATFSSEPFGGKQIVFSGDFFQLPPISRQGSQSAQFAAFSGSWHALNPAICYLETQYRQEDATLSGILSAIRAGEVTSAIRTSLNERLGASLDGDIVPTRLFCHNFDVDGLNTVELERLSGKDHVYRMERSGPRHLTDGLQKSCLAPAELALKKGAAVMFVRNNFEEGYVNGTLGTVVDFESGLPVVETKDGRRLIPTHATWKIDDGGESLAEIRQLPLRLAWAITVHKSQGMSLDAAIIDLSRSFEEGMGYVALSRVRSLEGMSLAGINDRAFAVRDSARKLDELFVGRAGAAVEALRGVAKVQLSKWHAAFLESAGGREPAEEEDGIDDRHEAHIKPSKKFERVSRARGKSATSGISPTYTATKKLLSERTSLAAIAKARGMTLGTIIGHIEKLVARGDFPVVSYLKREFSHERLEEIREAFETTGERKLAPVYALLGGDVSYEEIRLARALLFGGEAEGIRGDHDGESAPSEDPLSTSHAPMRHEFSSAYTRWTPKDDAQLLRAIKEGQTIADVAASFGRKPSAIRSRLKKLTPNI